MSATHSSRLESSRCRTVVEVSYDPVIADGEHLDLALRPATRDASLTVTAALTDGLTG